MLITLELCRFAWFPSQAALKNNTIQHKLKADDSCEANKISQLKLIFSSGLEQTWNEIEREIMRCSIFLKIHSALQKSHSTPVTSSDSNGFGAHCVTFCLLFCSVNSSVLIKMHEQQRQIIYPNGEGPSRFVTKLAEQAEISIVTATLDSTEENMWAAVHTAHGLEISGHKHLTVYLPSVRLCSACWWSSLSSSGCWSDSTLWSRCEDPFRPHGLHSTGVKIGYI